MTQTQIRYFLMVAQTGSVSKTAEQLYVSQPAISRQLALLEDELGVRLFQRSNNSISITDTGRVFEQFFLNSRLQFEQLLGKYRGKEQELTGDYHIALIEGWDPMSFYSGLFDFLEERYPKIRFHIHSCNLDHTLHALQRNDVDGAFMIDFLLGGYSDLQLEFLTQVDSCIILKAGSPLLDKPDLTVKDFANSTFFISAPKGTKTAVAEGIAISNATGFTPKLEYCQTLSDAYMKLQMGRGVMFKTTQMQVKSNPLFQAFPINYKRNVCFAVSQQHKAPQNLYIKEDIVQFCRSSAPLC